MRARQQGHSLRRYRRHSEPADRQRKRALQEWARKRTHSLAGNQLGIDRKIDRRTDRRTQSHCAKPIERHRLAAANGNGQADWRQAQVARYGNLWGRRAGAHAIATSGRWAKIWCFRSVTCFHCGRACKLLAGCPLERNHERPSGSASAYALLASSTWNRLI